MLKPYALCSMRSGLAPERASTRIHPAVGMGFESTKKPFVRKGVFCLMSGSSVRICYLSLRPANGLPVE
jgi:hypothetical protein